MIFTFLSSSFFFFLTDIYQETRLRWKRVDRGTIVALIDLLCYTQCVMSVHASIKKASRKV